jgi:hypothetical protein
LRILFDSGSEGTLINKKLCKNLPKIQTETTVWKTKAGVFKTNQVCPITLKLPAFHEHKEIQWNTHIEPTGNDLGRYDMIIGRDLMLAVGIDLMFSQEKIIWENADVKMQHPDFLKDERWVDILEKEIMYIHDPDTTDAKRIQDLMDAKYSKADLRQTVNEVKNLTAEEKEKLLNLLQKFESVFDGSLGAWNTEPVELELKDPECTPYHSKPYPVPQAQEAKLRAEVDRLCQYGILRKINCSE